MSEPQYSWGIRIFAALFTVAIMWLGWWLSWIAFDWFVCVELGLSFLC